MIRSITQFMWKWCHKKLISKKIGTIILIRGLHNSFWRIWLDLQNLIGIFGKFLMGSGIKRLIIAKTHFFLESEQMFHTKKGLIIGKWMCRTQIHLKQYVCVYAVQSNRQLSRLWSVGSKARANSFRWIRQKLRPYWFFC